MTKRLLEAEMHFLSSELIIKKLLKAKIITDQEYQTVHKKLIDAYITTISRLSPV